MTLHKTQRRERSHSRYPSASPQLTTLTDKSSKVQFVSLTNPCVNDDQLIPLCFPDPEKTIFLENWSSSDNRVEAAQERGAMDVKMVNKKTHALT